MSESLTIKATVESFEITEIHYTFRMKIGDYEEEVTGKATVEIPII